MQNGRKMDSDEMLSGGTTRTRRGTTVEMSNPESAIHSTPNRSLASTQEWCVGPDSGYRPAPGCAAGRDLGTNRNCSELDCMDPTEGPSQETAAELGSRVLHRLYAMVQA